MSPKPMFASQGAADAPSELEVAQNDAGPPPSEPALVESRWSKLAAAADKILSVFPQWKRMIFHVLGISAAAGLCLVVEDPYVRGGLVIFSLLLALAYEYGRKSKRNWFGRLCNRAVVREHEVGTRAASTDFGIAMALVAMFCPPGIGATAFLVAAWSDPIARFCGMRYGTLRWYRSKKTVEGSLAGFLTAVLLIASFGPVLPIGSVLGVAAVAMTVELIPETVLQTRFGPLLTPCDNFYIPVCTAAALAIATA